MEMEIWMDSLLLHQHLHLNPPPSPSSGQEAISSYYNYYPPYAVAAAAAMTSNNRRDADVDPTPPPQPLPSRTRAAGRKDRHSKICTAGGMRDRRMRLSLDVARRFFSLQDKLGFDKASKTVQWLLDMSTAGINHLLAASATSMSQDGSGSVLLDLDSNDHIMVADTETNNWKMPTKARRKVGRKSNNGVPALLPDKESRARARQRARERTIERSRLRSSTISSTAEEAPARAPAATQVISPVIPPGSSSFGSYYEEQEPWELGGVVFAKPRFHY